MSERKNIDRLFQEKFKDFESLPSDQLWENIQHELNNEKKRKSGVLPFWLSLCGTAAVFLIGFAVVSTFLSNPNGNNQDNPSVANSGNDSRATTADTSSDQTNGFANQSGHDAVATTSAGASTTMESERTTANPSGESTPKKYSDTPQNTVFATNAKKHSRQKSTSDKSSVVAHQDMTQTHSSGDPKNNTISSTSEKWNSTIPVDTQKAIVEHSVKSSQEDTEITLDTANPNHENVEDLLYEDNSSKVAFEAGKGRYVKKEFDKTASFTQTKPDERGLTDKTNPSIIRNEKALTKALSDKKAIVSKDSLSKAIGTPEQNPLDKLLKEKEDAEKDDKKVKKESRWAVNPKVSPIFMNASGSASTIDAQFDNNDRNYQTSFSYGVGVDYAVNKKLSVRTGINKLSMQYDTNGILFYESKDSRNLQNVRRNATGSSIQIEDKDARVMAFNQNSLVTEKTSGALAQKMGYIEVPLEVSYKVLDKKFGIEVIGGLSTLFLDENKISVVSANQEMVIGEAKNLNDIHLSSNVGLGFNYKFSKAFEAGVEPMFKYQINTYSNNAGDFKPYFFGLYTGICYRF